MIHVDIHFKNVKGHNRYKYQVITVVMAYTGIFGKDVKKYLGGKLLFHLKADGVLIIYPPYAWDGSSGPVYDSKGTMLASLVHDIIYQMLRDELLLKPEDFDFGIEAYNEAFVKLRNQGDVLYRKIMLDDGVWRIWAWIQYRGLICWGRSSALPDFLK